jgi:nucleotide-binding universal stress UspA family protein
MERQTTSTFRRILVPLDGSTLAEQALPYVRAIGGADAEFELLAVVPPAEAEDDLRGIDLLVLAAVPQSRSQQVIEAHAGAPVEEVQARSEAAARERLLTAARTWLGGLRNVRLRVTAGDPAAEILRLAEERDADLIVLASHGRGTVGRAVFGSVADRVVRSSSVPVMIVRPRDAAVEIAPIFLDRVIVPLDGSDLAARALPVAEGLARRRGLPVHLLRPLDAGQLLGPIAASAGRPPTTANDAAAEARRALEATAVLLRAAGVRVTTEVVKGSPASIIAGAARPGDIIVLSSHGRGGMRRWWLGSVAERLVHAGPAPVIVGPVAPRPAAVTSRPLAAPAT